MSDLRRAWDNAVRAAEFRGYVAGRMGYVDESGMVTILVPNRPNHCYVSLGAEGDQGVTIARNLGAPRIAWVPIRLKREQGELLIEGLDPTPGRLEAFFGGEAAPGNVGYHTHKIGSGLEYEVEALRLQPGRVRAAGGMDVYIEAFRYYVGGAWQTWEGGTLDLTAYQPSTADKWAWVLVGINPNTNAAIAVTGDEYDVETELTADLIDDIDFGDYIPCGAVKVREDDTAVTDIADYADAHNWFGASPHNLYLDEMEDVTLTSEAANDELYYDGSVWVNGGHRQNVGAATNIAISGGTLDISGVSTKGLIDVRGEGDLADEVVTISGGNVGDVIVLHTEAPGTYGNITIKSTGNINIAADITLDSAHKSLTLILTLAGWNPLGPWLSDYGGLNDLDDVTIDGTPADDEVLAYDSGTGEWINQTADEAGLGVVDELNDLNDVVIDGTQADNEVLAWDSGSSKWINQTAAEAGLSTVDAIDDLSDVVITTPADDEVLAYDSGTGEWINQTADEAGFQAQGERQNIGTPQDVTISGGTADISSYTTTPFFNIRGEGGLADELETLTATGSSAGDIIYLTGANETITVKDAIGNIVSDGDRTLNSGQDTITLRYDGSNWIEIAFISPT